jgi:hypothetical protein
MDDARRPNQRIDTIQFSQHAAAAVFLGNTECPQFFVLVVHVLRKFLDDLGFGGWIQPRPRNVLSNGLPPIRQSPLQ